LSAATGDHQQPGADPVVSDKRAYGRRTGFEGGDASAEAQLGASRQQVSEMLEKFSSFRTSPATQRKIYGHWKADGNRINIEWQGMRNNGTCAGSFDLSKMKMSLPNVGILHEGASVEFTRQ